MNIYLIVTFAIIIVGTITWFWKIRRQQINTLASIVTVIGVLGTFLGIAIGLYQFDTGNIESSVPKLLNGLKFAFVTSILGIAGSIALKWYALSQPAPKGPATVDDLAELLQNLLAVKQEEAKETRETLRSIERSLTGEGDSTVLTQLQKLRTTFSDKQDDLIRVFNEFADQMAENNTNALIEALEEVMRDFNAKISEQFGENFKQLNEAVGRINEWQKQYRQDMDKLAAEFQIAAASIEKSRESLEIIAERSGAIVSNSEKLDPILQVLQHQIQQLNNHLRAFSELADNAREAFPIIEVELNNLTVDFSRTVKRTIADSDKAIENQRKALANQSEQLEKTAKESTKLMKEQIQVLDEALERELTKAVESLGSHLTSLSSKFAADYSPLTEKLRNVVEIASSLPQPPQHQ